VRLDTLATIVCSFQGWQQYLVDMKARWRAFSTEIVGVVAQEEVRISRQELPQKIRRDSNGAYTSPFIQDAEVTDEYLRESKRDVSALDR